MEENTEVKDVLKTEYLDKNGLDMLWAKVKENTHNLVEAESNRATIQETRIIETKADKSEFDNYAPNTALEALEEKISANTAAISNKQNAGNYLHYETLNNEGYYEIPSVCIPNSDESTKTNISSDEIRVSNRDLGFTFITGDRIRYYHNDEGSLGFDLNSDGLKLQGGDNNHVLTSGGSTIDVRDYAKKTEVSDFISKTTTNDLSIKSSLDVSGALSLSNNTNSSNIRLNASNGAPFLNMYAMGGNQYNASLTTRALTMSSTKNSVSITCDGISSKDNNANHVYATDGSIADLTQYALSSTLAALEVRIAALKARIAALEAKHAETA